VVLSVIYNGAITDTDTDTDAMIVAKAVVNGKG